MKYATLLIACLFCTMLHADQLTITPTFAGGPVAIPDGQSPPNWGTAATIDLNTGGALQRNVTGVRISVTFSHAYAGDVGMFLRAPGGVATHILFERVGALTPTGGGYDATFNGTYTFRDDASGNLWTAADNAQPGGTVPPGTFRTSVEGGGASGGMLTSMNNSFAGLTPTQANGTWQLFAADWAQTDTGQITAVTLIIFTESASSGGGGEDDSGCSTGDKSGLTFLSLLAAISAMTLVCRVRTA